MLRKVIVAAAAALALSACATATPYQPNIRGAATSGGFSEIQLEQNRFRVNFAGNSLTSRERVETYLLFRAAELTLAQGYDWFSTVDRTTERETRTYVDRPFGGSYFGSPFYRPYAYWRPYWRYHGPRWGWRHWDPFFGDPFFGDRLDVRQVDRYEATAEIVMGRGAKPADDPRVFEAREVARNLAPYIQYPQPR